MSCKRTKAELLGPRPWVSSHRANSIPWPFFLLQLLVSILHKEVCTLSLTKTATESSLCQKLLDLSNRRGAIPEFSVRTDEGDFCQFRRQSREVYTFRLSAGPNQEGRGNIKLTQEQIPKFVSSVCTELTYELSHQKLLARLRQEDSFTIYQHKAENSSPSPI